MRREEFIQIRAQTERVQSLEGGAQYRRHVGQLGFDAQVNVLFAHRDDKPADNVRLDGSLEHQLLARREVAL